MTPNQRNRLVDMKRCLEQIKEDLPHSAGNIFAFRPSTQPSQFICTHINEGPWSSRTKEDTESYIQRAIAPHFTFNQCLDAMNPGRHFGNRQVMHYRRKLIDILCGRIDKELQS